MNDGSALWLILTLAVLVLFSAFFSATETAYTSFSPVRLKTLAKTKKSARLAVRLSENYNKVLSTLLIGNNIVNISAASIATIIFTRYYGEIGVTLSTIVMTVVVLIFGEISPKTIAKEKPETFAMFSAWRFMFLQSSSLHSTLFSTAGNGCSTKFSDLTKSNRHSLKKSFR